MVPDMAPCDRAAFDPNQPVMLEIVEGFDPEACAGHAREHDRHRGPAAHQKDDRLHDDLRKQRLPDPVADRPAAMPLFLERVAFHPPCVARALHHGTPGKAIDRYAAPRGVAVFDGRDIAVMARDMGDFAGAIEIADLRIGSDETPTLK